MARAIWKGILVLEKQRVPVKLYSAAREKTVRFHLLHDADQERVRQRMINPATGEEVAREQTRRGAEVGPGQFVVISPEDLAGIEPAESRDITIERFVKPEQINDPWYDRPYFLGPDESSEKYWALAQALADEKLEGVARWTMRKREYVGALRAVDGCLALIALRFSGEVIPVEDIEVPGGRKPDEREMRMAQQLVEALSGPFQPADFHDEYRERLMKYIEQKARGHKLRLHKPTERKPAGQNLADILEASLHANRKSRASA